MSSKHFLFIGAMNQKSVSSKLALDGILYNIKMLESSPKNWEKTIEILENPGLVGVVAKFGRTVYSNAFSVDHSEVAPRLFAALSRVPHVVFVHEDILNGVETYYPFEQVPYLMQNGEIGYEEYSSSAQLSIECTKFVNNLLEKHGVQVTAYQKNAELAVLSESFINDLENNLLFRLYVPSDRIYANEVARLLELFREWLSTAKKERIRQDGYKTSRGQVFEFFSEREMSAEEVSGEMQEFNRFLDICSHPNEANDLLVGMGIDRDAAMNLVHRYTKEVRRLRLDIKHEREIRILQVRQQLESDLTEETPQGEISAEEIQFLVASLIPESPADALAPVPQKPFDSTELNPRIQINQQFFEHAYGRVSQNISGTQSFGAQGNALMDIILDNADENEADLIASMHEIADTEARTADRLTAKQKLKSFLIRCRDNVESTVFSVAQSYIESQMGI